MAEPRHAPRDPKKRGASKKAEPKTLWSRLKGSAMFWLFSVAGFAILVVSGIIWLSALLSGN